MHRTPELSDEDCMIQLAEGKLDAATALFQRYNRRLFNFFLRQGVPAEASEDLVQNLFERLIKYRHTYRKGMTFRTWLYQIARNVQADWQRQSKRLPQKELDAGALHLPEHNSGLEQEEDLHLMEKAMQKLPPDQLEILLLTRYQRLKYIEVAELLGCSEGAVKLKVFRALQQLRSLYFKLEKL